MGKSSNINAKLEGLPDEILKARNLGDLYGFALQNNLDKVEKSIQNLRKYSIIVSKHENATRGNSNISMNKQAYVDQIDETIEDLLSLLENVY